jgi:hypothetical protein
LIRPPLCERAAVSWSPSGESSSRRPTRARSKRRKGRDRVRHRRGTVSGEPSATLSDHLTKEAGDRTYVHSPAAHCNARFDQSRRLELKAKGKRTVCHGQDLVKLRILAVSFTLQGINHVGQMISTIACAGRSVNDGLGVARGSCGRLGGVVLDRRERIRLCAYDVLVVAPGVESELLTPQSADSCTFARLSARLLRTQKRDAPATYRHDESVCCARRACQLLRLDRLRTARPRAGWRLR